MLGQIPLLDAVAFFSFFSVWIGYSLFARKRAKVHHSLSSILCTLRVEWMQAVTRKEQHIADAALIGNVERTVTFFASSTIFVLAGVLTVTASNDAFVRVLHELPFTAEQSHTLVLLKLAGLSMIMVYAFFKFTWAVRKFGFVSILLGMAPTISNVETSDEVKQRFAVHTAKIIDQAGHEYNFGLRAYYFALAYLCWFVSPVLLIIAALIVTGILYRREYHSRVLRALLATQNYVPGPKATSKFVDRKE